MSQRTGIDTVPATELERWQGGGRIAGIAVFIVLITAAVLALPGSASCASASPGRSGANRARPAARARLLSRLRRGVSGRLLAPPVVALLARGRNVLSRPRTCSLPTAARAGWRSAPGTEAGRQPAERIGSAPVAFFLLTSTVNFAAVVLPGSASRSVCFPAGRRAPDAAVPAMLALAALLAIALLQRLLGNAETRRRDGLLSLCLLAPRPRLPR